jgi:hypothetical protein
MVHESKFRTTKKGSAKIALPRYSKVVGFELASHQGHARMAFVSNPDALVGG